MHKTALHGPKYVHICQAKQTAKYCYLVDRLMFMLSNVYYVNIFLLALRYLFTGPLVTQQGFKGDLSDGGTYILDYFK